MQLKTKVKVGNVTNLSDARYCAGMGVDLLGFPIGHEDGQISPEVFQEIANWVAGPEFVFEYNDNIDQDQFEKVTHLPSTKHVQVTYSQIIRLGNVLESLSIIPKVSAEEFNLLKNQKLSIAYVILQGDGSPLYWKHAGEINELNPVLIPHHLLQSSVNEITKLPIAGIVLEGSAEDKPGQKNYDHLADVLESLEVE